MGGCDHLLSPFVFDDDHRLVGEATGEEHGLRGEVLLHRVVEVEVVLGQVGEAGDAEVSTVDAMLTERV